MSYPFAVHNYATKTFTVSFNINIDRYDYQDGVIPEDGVILDIQSDNFKIIRKTILQGLYDILKYSFGDDFKIYSNFYKSKDGKRCIYYDESICIFGGKMTFYLNDFIPLPSFADKLNGLQKLINNKYKGSGIPYITFMYLKTGGSYENTPQDSYVITCEKGNIICDEQN